MGCRIRLTVCGIFSSNVEKFHAEMLKIIDFDQKSVQKSIENPLIKVKDLKKIRLRRALSKIGSKSLIFPHRAKNSTYEDDFVKVAIVGRFRGSDSVLSAVRVIMTPRRRDRVRWKGNEK